MNTPLHFLRGACCGVIAVVTTDGWLAPVVVLVALVSALVLTDEIHTQQVTR